MQINLNHNTTTEFDKNIETLARSLADCTIKIYDRHICTTAMCVNCPTGQKQRACLKEMAVCDKLRVEQEGADIVGAYRGRQYSKKEGRKSMAIIVLALVWFFLGFAYFMSRGY